MASSNTIGLLHEEILFHIFHFMSTPTSVEVASRTCVRLEQTHTSIKMHDITRITTDGLLNRLLGLEFELQSAVQLKC